MTAALVEATALEIRKYLSHHATVAVRPVPLAQLIGERDIRRVRSALTHMAEAGELVSCVVIKDGERDHEYRLSTGTSRAHDYRSLQPGKNQAMPRRPDASSVPSRFTDLPRGERPNNPVKVEVAYVADPTTEAPPRERAQPAPQREKPARTSATPPPAAKPAVVAKAAAADDAKAYHRGVWRGATPTRKTAILAYIESVRRPVTSSELFDYFHPNEPNLQIWAISGAINKMASPDVKRLVSCGRVSEPRRGGLMLMAYATPAIAKEYLEGRGGESTPAARPVTAEPAPAPSAPRESEPIAQKTAQDAPHGARCDARALLEHRIVLLPKSAYSLAWILRAAEQPADVPELLELIARWQREGRLEYLEVDGSLPTWRPVEGRW